MHYRLLCLRSAFAAALLLEAAAAAAQPAIVDLHNPKPRELQSVVFTLAAAQDVRVEAVGAESESRSNTFSWLTAMWTSDTRREPWIGDAWILDLQSRKVIWELSAARTDRGRRGTRTFDGRVKLPAGTYQAFYGAFPNMFVTDGDGAGTGERFLRWLADIGFDEFRFSIHADGRVLTGADADRARHTVESNTIVALRGDGPERFRQAGFTLDRPTEIDIDAEGEAREDSEFDAGWIMNADTHEPIWKLTWNTSSPAGGAEKNRAAHLTKTLPAGRYAAIFATDDSHDTTAWNTQPPRDPDAWGLFLRVPEAARASVKPFTYEHVPASSTLVALTKIGDQAFTSRGFTLARPIDVRVYALGEGSRGRMVDYGWIMDASTHHKVWEMRYEDTEAAGGDTKNRVIDRTIHLDKGNYVVTYTSDDSHAYGAWNASAPRDAEHWGITLLAAHGASDRAAVSDYTDKPDPSVVAQLVRVRDDARPRASFTLDRETSVRIYALGEASGRDLADYGWIEDAKSGKTVWEMSYRMTDPAGGASKNRKFDGTITLPAGQYTLRFETDDSHAFGSWNATPPDDPEMWGITVYRVR